MPEFTFLLTMEFDQEITVRAATEEEAYAQATAEAPSQVHGQIIDAKVAYGQLIDTTPDDELD